MFLIIRDDGKYVSMAGSEHSYTSKFENARLFSKEGDADREKCSNETIVPLANVLRGLHR